MNKELIKSIDGAKFEIVFKDYYKIRDHKYFNIKKSN